MGTPRELSKKEQADLLRMRALFNFVIEKCSSIPALTGGGIYNEEFNKLGRKDTRVAEGFRRASATVTLYKFSRQNGEAARKWLNTPENIKKYEMQLRLSDQARLNWANSQPGNPFSGMIDTRTGLIYLIPATIRDDQRPWDLTVLRQQLFTKDGRHLADNNESPISNGKHKNTDHGRAAAFLDGCNYDAVTMLEKGVDPFTNWFSQQTLCQNWLGFFVHSDKKGYPVLNFNSAQLNAPNLAFQNLTEDQLFAKLKEHDLFSVISKKLTEHTPLSEEEKSAIVKLKNINEVIREKINQNDTLEENEYAVLLETVKQHHTQMRNTGIHEMCYLPLSMQNVITREIKSMPRAGRKCVELYTRASDSDLSEMKFDADTLPVYVLTKKQLFYVTEDGAQSIVNDQLSIDWLWHKLSQNGCGKVADKTVMLTKDKDLLSKWPELMDEQIIYQARNSNIFNFDHAAHYDPILFPVDYMSAFNLSPGLISFFTQGLQRLFSNDETSPLHTLLTKISPIQMQGLANLKIHFFDIAFIGNCFEIAKKLNLSAASLTLEHVLFPEHLKFKMQEPPTDGVLLQQVAKWNLHFTADTTQSYETTNAERLEIIGFNGEIPARFICPITKKIMTKPVRQFKRHSGSEQKAVACEESALREMMSTLPENFQQEFVIAIDISLHKEIKEFVKAKELAYSIHQNLEQSVKSSASQTVGEPAEVKLQGYTHAECTLHFGKFRPQNNTMVTTNLVVENPATENRKNASELPSHPLTPQKTST